MRVVTLHVCPRCPEVEIDPWKCNGTDEDRHPYVGMVPARAVLIDDELLAAAGPELETAIRRQLEVSDGQDG